MIMNKQVLNIENYRKLREEITTEIISVSNMELDVPRADDLVKVYEAVFTKVLEHMEGLATAGAKGEDFQGYVSQVAGIIQNAGLLAEKIQAVNLKQKEMDQYEKQVHKELEELQ